MDTPNILDGYVEQSKFAEGAGVCMRTVERYRSQPNGLPFLPFGGKIYIPLDEAREWLKDRVKRPNQRRAA